MKRLKMVPMFVTAAVLLMALAETAYAAPVLTSPAGTEYTGNYEMTAAQTFTMNASVFTITCVGAQLNGAIATNNTTHATGNLTEFKFTGCNGTVDRLAAGALTVNDAGEVFIGSNEITYDALGFTCIYGGGLGTKIGTLTAGTTATLTIAAELPKQPGSAALCAGKGTWTGKYTVTTPDTFLIT